MFTTNHFWLHSDRAINISVAELLRRRLLHSHVSLAESLVATLGCWSSKASLRDRISALLSLSNDSDLEAAEVADRTAAGISKSLCKLMAERFGGPIFLALCYPEEEEAWLSRLPSWVPNCNLRDCSIMVLAHPNSSFSVSTAPYTFTVDREDRLHCRGTVLERVKLANWGMAPQSICEQYSAGEDHGTFVVWYKEALDYESKYGVGNYVRLTDETMASDSEEAIVKFMETIQARGSNHLWDIQDAQRPSQIVARARGLLRDDIETMTNDRLTPFAACWPSFGRMFGITSSGRFCLLPLQSRPGDVVCIIKGFKVPVLLRRYRGNYRNLGECYIHGIMHGELGELEDEDIIIQ